MAILILLSCCLLGVTAGAATSASPTTPTKGPSSISLNLSSSSVEVGKTIHARGVLGISGTSIKLEVLLPNNTSVKPIQGWSTKTDITGAFSVDFVPGIPGTYELRAGFEGNAEFQGSLVDRTFNATTK